jgi:hypothetical protein
MATSMEVLLNKRAEPDRRAALRQAIDLCREPIALALAQNMTLVQIADELRTTWGVTSDITANGVENLRAGYPAHNDDADEAEPAGAPIAANTLSRYVQRVRIRKGLPDPAAPRDAPAVRQTLCPLPKHAHPDWAKSAAPADAATSTVDDASQTSSSPPDWLRDWNPFGGLNYA